MIGKSISRICEWRLGASQKRDSVAVGGPAPHYSSSSSRPHDHPDLTMVMAARLGEGAAEAQMVTGGLRRGWSRAEGKTGGDGGLRATVVGSRGTASRGSDLTSSGLGTRRGA